MPPAISNHSSHNDPTLWGLYSTLGDRRRVSKRCCKRAVLEQVYLHRDHHVLTNIPTLMFKLCHLVSTMAERDSTNPRVA